MIPYGRHEITQADIDAVTAVLRSDYLTQGPVVPRFEQTVAEYCGAGYAIAVNSATSALHIACLTLGLGPGDWLWTSPITFVASANCALYCGAQVDFVDIDPCTYNLSADSLAERLAVAEQEGRLPKIVVPVHLCGQSCDMEAINQLSKRYGFHVIEDASHAIGGRYKNDPIGCGRYSDITVFSFHPVKIITTGEGGMALTNDPVVADRMRRYRSHGITNDCGQMQPRADEEIWNYQQLSLGYNYRMTDIQAALGLSQLSRLDEFIAKRHQIAKHYDKSLADLPVIVPTQQPDTLSSYHLYPIRLRKSDCGTTQREVYDGLHKLGIWVNLHYIPVYRQPYYERLGFSSGYCAEAENYYKEAVSLPIFPTLTDRDQLTIVSALQKILIG